MAETLSLLGGGRQSCFVTADAAVLCHAACRYRLVAERPSRPAGETLDYIIMQAIDPEGAATAAEGSKPGGNRGLLDNLGATMVSMQRFMKSLSQ